MTTTDSSSSQPPQLDSPSPRETPRHVLAKARPTRTALRTGVYLGALLNIVMIGALVTANRFPRLEPYALERNAASYGLFVLFLLIPVIRFLTRPAQMFAAGLVGWVLFVAGYDLAGLYFHNLFDVLRTPFEALVEGCVLYGIAAVTVWVVRMIFYARRHTLAPRRRSAHHAVHYRP